MVYNIQTHFKDRKSTVIHTNKVFMQVPLSPTWSVYDDSDNSPQPSPSLYVKGHGLTQLRDAVRKVCVLARGAQGVVYAAVKRSDQKDDSPSMPNLVAIKRFISDYDDVRSRGFSETIVREISTHRYLHSLWLRRLAGGADKPQANEPFPFVDIEDVLHGPHQEVCAVLSFCPLDLASEPFCKALRSSSLSLRDRIDIVRYVLRASLKALAFMHKNEILHRDVKLSNLLIDGNGNIRLGDLGSAKRLQRLERGHSTGATSTTRQRTLTPAVRRTTLLYRSPETVLGFDACRYGAPADVWALGVVFAELLLTAGDAVGTSVGQSKRGPQHLFPIQGELHLAAAVLKLLGPMRGDESFLEKDSKDHVEVNGSPKRLRSESTLGISTPKEYEGTLRIRFSNLISEDGFDLLQKMLTLDPALRINAYEALGHQFLTETHAADEKVQKLFIELCQKQVQNIMAKGNRPTEEYAAQEIAPRGVSISLGLEAPPALPLFTTSAPPLQIPLHGEISSTAKAMKPVTLAFGEDEDDDVDDPFF